MSIPYLKSILFGEDHDHEEADPVVIVVLKSISFLLILAFGVGFVLMPYFIQSCRQSSKFLGLANAFSGGIFLGIGLFHLLPEANEYIHPFLEEHGEWHVVPVPYILAFISYSLILFVEKVAFDSHALMHQGHAHGGHQIHSEVKDSSIGKVLPDQSQDEKLLSNNTESGNTDQVVTVTKEGEHEHEHEHKHEHGHGHEHGHHHGKFTPYILLIALGLHGFFEGLALGLADSYGGILVMLGAILAHKWAESLTLGISFVRANTQKKQFLTMALIFGAIGPLGVVIGWVLSEVAISLVQGIFLALSTGTFLYVACTEVIVEEFDGDHRFLKFGLYLIAAVLIVALTIFEHLFGGHDHDHDH